jgi:hypothetical protein
VDLTGGGQQGVGQALPEGSLGGRDQRARPNGNAEEMQSCKDDNDRTPRPVACDPSINCNGMDIYSNYIDKIH